MKDAYYFSHDSNAKDDPKCVMLIEQLGLEGYGIYWVLIEMLRDQPGYKYPIALIPAISRRYNTTAEKMKTVVNNYGLFEIDDNDFFSPSLMRRMERLDHKREVASLAGKKSAEKRILNAGSTDVQQTFSDRSTIKTNESKTNENKLKESKADILFAHFWDAYPKQKSKGQAKRAFAKLKVDEQFLEVILTAIERAKKSTDWQKNNGQYIPYPATWLNAEGWEDINEQHLDKPLPPAFQSLQDWANEEE